MGSMAIRFKCASCAQPIEVDDEWASKAVICPYCRDTVTAPGESTIDDAALIRTAGKVDTDTTSADASAGPEGYTAKVNEASANGVAVAAMVLACSTVAMLGAADLILAPHSDEVNRLIEAMRPARTFAEMMEVQNQFIQEMGGMPSWMVWAFICEVSAACAWVAALVCGLLGLRRVRRRRLAAAALVVTAVVPIFFCCGGLLGTAP